MIYSGLILGLAGSLHCIGMCGPIALALPVARMQIWQRTLAIVLYNIGRSITYAVMGLAFGAVGHGIAMGGFQQYAAIGAGVFMILWGLKYYLKIPFLERVGNPSAPGIVQRNLGRLLSQPSLSNLFLLGMLNGLLPCGLVYFALAGAIALGNTLHAGVFMLAFGLGTLPVMMAVSMVGSQIGQRARVIFSRLVPILLIVMGSLVLMRGMSLGIPYISPDKSKLSIQAQEKVESVEKSCCH